MGTKDVGVAWWSQYVSVCVRGEKDQADCFSTLLYPPLSFSPFLSPEAAVEQAVSPGDQARESESAESMAAPWGWAA